MTSVQLLILGSLCEEGSEMKSMNGDVDAYLHNSWADGPIESSVSNERTTINVVQPSTTHQLLAFPTRHGAAFFSLTSEELLLLVLQYLRRLNKQ